MTHASSIFRLIILAGLLSFLPVPESPSEVFAAQLTLSWTDNSNNEDGFVIERRTGTSGSFAQMVLLSANITSFTDQTLADGTTYCYRLRAYNSAGNSAYSNEQCATTPGATPTYTLTVNKSGNGSGTVTASGINCGTDCTENYASGTSVTLTATAAAGSTFAGWSGNADCSDGMVAMSGSMTCTATFNVVSGYALTVSIVNQATAGGTAGGRVISSPAGIDCGADCNQSYASGTVVALTPLAETGSVFNGWSGDPDCSDGSVTMNANKSCNANFALSGALLTVAKTGSGSVASTPSGINCGSTCSYSFATGSAVTLQATPASGFTFAGWTGAGCRGTNGCTITLSSDTTVTAKFVGNQSDKIGVYRASSREWFLDQNGNGVWDGCNIDGCIQSFGENAALPVVGDWNGSGLAQIGLFLTESAQWQLDRNSNKKWDGCRTDTCLSRFGEGSDLPVVGKWSAKKLAWIGVFQQGTGRWYLDSNGDGNLSNCGGDRCGRLGVYLDGDLPVTGDWSGNGVTQLGLYRPSTGEWFLDANGNKSWNGCNKDICISSFGTAEDLPVAGDWDGTGVSKIGVFRPSTGEWFLDLNGNGQWDGCAMDLCLSGFGDLGDMPVAGKW